METLQVKDKKFAVSIPEAEILKQVKRVAGEINRDYEGREPLFLAVLNGAFIFAADLMKEVVLPSEIQFIKLASYEGTTSTGAVTETIGMTADISGRDVVIIEDIVDTGNTLQALMDLFEARQAASIGAVTLLSKPSRREVDVDVKWSGYTIPNEFAVGYGLDFENNYRHLPYIGVLKEEIYR